MRFPREPKDNSTNSTNPSLGVFPDFSYERIGKLGDPRQIGERLQGPLGEFWRYRVGDYRIICTHDTRDSSCWCFESVIAEKFTNVK